jgi:hypothetical protein
MIKHAILEISNFKQVERADIPPADGYALVVDGHIKHRYDDERGSSSGCRTPEEISCSANQDIRRCDEDAGFAEITRHLSY